MNKRIKKKWSRMARLENKVGQLMAENTLLMAAVKQQNQQMEELRLVHSRNVEATNLRFDQLESENKDMRIDLDQAIIEFSKPKKSWFCRK